jgi:predicted Zn-dependent protease
MSRSADLVARTLEVVGSRAEAGVYVRTGTAALTRFANSFIHQNVADDVCYIHVTLAMDGKVAAASTTVPTSESLSGLVDRLIDVARVQAVDDDFPGVGGPVDVRDIEHWDEETAEMSPAARASKVKEFVDAGSGLLGAGMCGVDSFEDAYGNTSGRFVAGRMTRVVLDGIHQTDASAGSGHSTGVSLGSVDAAAAGELAAHRARRGIAPFDAKPGRYEVVLAPEAMATIAQFLTSYGFSGKNVNENRSFVTLGEAPFDPAVTLTEDVADPRSIGLPFDGEGSPRSTLKLIDSGLNTAVLHDRTTGKKAGASTTGHAPVADESWDNKPDARNVFLPDGSLGVQDLIAGVEQGIYVSTFNYCRVLDPKTLVVTGLTRNGTFIIENGIITNPVTNLRFTQSFVDALGPGHVVGIGSDGRFAAGEEDSGTVHTPSFHLADWNFTGGADG